ncbi:MAG: hypothetical protein SF187_24630 [Deltaproteobacteria bacterium]|nr:hypothetical protein [Deltaproteobacteria bacterium]
MKLRFGIIQLLLAIAVIGQSEFAFAQQAYPPGGAFSASGVTVAIGKIYQRAGSVHVGTGVLYVSNANPSNCVYVSGAGAVYGSSYNDVIYVDTGSGIDLNGNCPYFSGGRPQLSVQLQIYGQSGNDDIYGGLDAGRIEGGNGDDRIQTMGTGYVYIDGGSGNDRIRSLGVCTNAVWNCPQLWGSADNDCLEARSNAYVNGNGGSNICYLEPGATIQSYNCTSWGPEAICEW